MYLRERPPPWAAEDPGEFEYCIIDDYIDSDHVCQCFLFYRPAIIYGLI
jgi:hypothetical protein